MVDGTSATPVLGEVLSSLASVAVRTERERFRKPYGFRPSCLLNSKNNVAASLLLAERDASGCGIH